MWHPLAAHMLDVAACAERMLDKVRPTRLDAMARALRLPTAEALPWLVLFVMLHDLGKATPAFQRKVDHATQRLLALGFDFPDSTQAHGEMSAVLVPDALVAHGVPFELALLVARAVGAHHGAFAESDELNSLDGVLKHMGKRAVWAQARVELVRDLVALIGVGAPPQVPRSHEEVHAFAVDLAGLTTAADWIGSNAEVFQYVEGPSDLSEYFQQARRLAEDAVGQAGFRRSPVAPARSFQALFGKTPWPLHEAMAGLLPTLAPGSLVIVEAPMGEGKTEAALMAYDALTGRGADGLFFALPTQATANQILGRVERYLTTSFVASHGLHLVHGGAALSDRYAALKKRAFHPTSIDGAAGAGDHAPIADAWFAKSKRALLAPLGVGTVDQALLGVLRAKHHFLRLHGLAGKVIIIDEVHAYDTFTSSLLARLCEWLRALGGTVMLLSATLSSPQRARLLAAYGADPPTELPTYPRITIAHEGQCRTVPFASRRSPVEVRLEWKMSDSLPGELAAALKGGGSVAWIVNTVGRAQRLYTAMRELRAQGGLPSDLDLRLLHARLPFAERLARERAAETAFGPSGKSTSRPRRALLIGTQVLEQSLDLDFDLMITEVAPVDLVLQRAGRLHRHDREGRPEALRTRTLWIELPEHADRPQGPDFGASEYVYDEAILLSSYLALRACERVTLPTDIEPLVESVYAEGAARAASESLPAALANRLRDALDARSSQASGDKYKADLKVLPAPAESDPFRAFSCSFDDEDPEVHEALRAVTRLGEKSLTVVPVVPVAGGLQLAIDPTVVFDPDSAVLPFATATAIARGALSVGHRGLVHALLHDHPRAFERSGVLRHHRLLRLDEARRADVAGNSVLLDPALGLVIGRLAKPGTS
jgi:CRISPR-associated endonuclease/helicase Cas3